MKNLIIFPLSMILICGIAFIQCKQSPTAESDVTERIAALPDSVRDLPGLSFQRGLISSTDEATPGYILFHPTFGTSSYLLNLDGKVVHEWKGEYNTMLSYLMDNGNVIRGDRDPYFPTFAAGGQSGRIREYNWDGDLIWDFDYISEEYLTHHDMAIMPNGNILAIAWEVITKEECVALGINPEHLPEAGLWFDKIIEIEPTRPNGGNIVWEWRMWDHLIQDFDASKPNYGAVIENPYKININPHIHHVEMTEEQVKQAIEGGFMTSNATVENQGSDLTHLNAIYYNAELDQIAISSYYFNEIYIIDHSTTTREASGSTGGRYGRGGDLLYRWGNPQNYGRGGPENRKLFHQHDVRWIPQGYPGAGNLMVFNNDIYGGEGQFPGAFAALSQLQRPTVSLAELDNYSAVLELELPVTDDGNYSLPDGKPFGPDEPVWMYQPEDPHSFYAPFVSSAHRMLNGNTFVNSGPRGRFMEVTPEGQIVWEYLNPFSSDYRLPDGTLPQPAGPFFYAQFRVTHIPADHPALAGRELTPIDPQPEVFVPPPPPEKEM